MCFFFLFFFIYRHSFSLKWRRRRLITRKCRRYARRSAAASRASLPASRAGFLSTTPRGRLPPHISGGAWGRGKAASLRGWRQSEQSLRESVKKRNKQQTNETASRDHVRYIGLEGQFRKPSFTCSAASDAARGAIVRARRRLHQRRAQTQCDLRLPGSSRADNGIIVGELCCRLRRN